ncbi:EAL domain-containing protein [Methylobacillus caricis]|uniref:EAL domain-containing protein n=1 Tax=Methylobacillus caricis TaxID=1971611 RepID=UPI001CFFB460|nr:EAL domain-containing protein [Methylobacillus caricis]MCB5186489.1 EAL domain-containing protein [Methylobacillus caricis]
MNAFNRSEIGALMLGHEVEPADLQPSELLDVILGRRFGAHYQPIVEVQSGELLGYQASSRFWTPDYHPIDAGKMFASLQKNPLLLFYIELEMKKLQVSQFPGTGWLMMDLDIDSFFLGGSDMHNPFLALFKEHAWSERELIVNIVDNKSVADTYRAQRMISMLQQCGTSVALEDVGISWGMFSLSAFMDASIIKFSSMALRALDIKAAQATVDWLISAARKIGVQTVMSEVDTCASFDWARRMGVDCVQGSLFARQDLQVR